VFNGSSPTVTNVESPLLLSRLPCAAASLHNGSRKLGKKSILFRALQSIQAKEYAAQNFRMKITVAFCLSKLRFKIEDLLRFEHLSGLSQFKITSSGTSWYLFWSINNTNCFVLKRSFFIHLYQLFRVWVFFCFCFFELANENSRDQFNSFHIYFLFVLGNVFFANLG